MSTSNRYSDHHDLTHNKICVTAMIPDLDIYRSANVLIREHGEDAALGAAMRADAMLEKGDLEGQVVWKRIVRAVEEMQRTDRPSGEVLQ